MVAAVELGVEPNACAGVEDSGAVICAAHAAGMRVVAYPNRQFGPAADALALAHVLLLSLDELTPALIAGTEPGQR